MKLITEKQVSAGGVVFRPAADGHEVVLIRVDRFGESRWQLPKGIVEADEDPLVTATREIREETGLTAEPLDQLDTIEYWYVGKRGDQAIRYHKFVHFYLFRFVEGDTADHDWEVVEARWFDLATAVEELAFPSEQAVVEQAAIQLEQLT